MAYPKILLMEDDEGQARLTQKHLQKAGYEIDIAKDGEQGLAMFKISPYPVVLIDMNMPHKSGMSVLKELNLSPSPPVTIMVTGSGDETSAVEAIKLGAYDYIVKDVEGDFHKALPKAINQAMDRHDLWAMKKQAEKNLLETKEKLDSIVNTIPDIIYRLDLKGYITFISDAVKKYGYEPEEVIGEHFLKFVHPQDQITAQRSFERHEHASYTESLELRLLKKTGEYTVMEVFSKKLDSQVGYQNHAASGSQGIARDITLRKEAEKALKESEAKYATVVEHASDALLIVQDMKFKFVNKAWSEMTGYSQEELKQMPLGSLVIPKQKDLLFTSYKAKLNKKKAPFLLPLKITRKDNSILEIEISALSITYEGRPAIMAIVRDITKRKKAEKAVLEKERLRAAIETAGAVCHELNQPLQTILGNTELMLLEAEPDHPDLEILTIMKEQAQRMADLTRSLQRITKFETKQYVGRSRILDIKRSTKKPIDYSILFEK